MDLIVSIIRLESWGGECNDMVKRKLKRKQNHAAVEVQ